MMSDGVLPNSDNIFIAPLQSSWEGKNKHYPMQYFGEAFSYSYFFIRSTS